MTLEISDIRRQMPALTGMVYLNTGWSGPSPDYVVEAIEKRLRLESSAGPTSPEALEDGQRIQGEAKSAAAALFGAAEDEVLLTENTTEGLNIVLNGIDWRPGDEIVICDLEHASVQLPTYALQARQGIVLRIVSPASNASSDELVSLYSESMGPSTRLVMLSHVQYSSGLRMPVAEIAEAARAVGAMVLVDGAQGPGHLELDVRALGVDFYSSPGQKWLLGPDQTGALFIRREMISRLSPVRIGFGFATSHDLEGGFDPRVEEIDKFMVSTTSSALRAGYLAAAGRIIAQGMGEVEDRQIALGDRLRSHLSDTAGVTVLSPLDGPGRSALTSFAIDGMEPADVAGRLWAGDLRILVRHIGYPPGIRASTAFFNTEEEIDTLAGAVANIARQR